uniref:Actin-binding, cofilin/tropomyosin type n=1 Tax=Tanacetum cinerariifolium TaxID=118510 RepID=A0A699H4M6_TANCI|nr:actin-binding, cofilin/tropomyosin type [Tanacetum cinerariifolium]
MILESIVNGTLIWPMIEENRVTKPRKYSELSPLDAIQADCDVKATNIIIQGLLPEQCDDPIDAINHMMSFLSAVVASRYPTTNNQLRNSSNPRKQATINDERVTLQPVQGRKVSFAIGTTRTYTPGVLGSELGSELTSFTGSELDIASYRDSYTQVVDADITPVNDQAPSAKVHLTSAHNVLANEQQHTDQSEPSYDTYLLEKGDSNTTPDSTNMSNKGGEIDQDAEQDQVKSP